MVSQASGRGLLRGRGRGGTRGGTSAFRSASDPSAASSVAGPPPAAASVAGPPPAAASVAGPPPASVAGTPPASVAGPPPASVAGPPPPSVAGPPPASGAGPSAASSGRLRFKTLDDFIRLPPTSPPPIHPLQNPNFHLVLAVTWHAAFLTEPSSQLSTDNLSKFRSSLKQLANKHKIFGIHGLFLEGLGHPPDMREADYTNTKVFEETWRDLKDNMER